MSESLVILILIKCIHSYLNVCLKSNESLIDHNEKSCNRILFVSLNETSRSQFKSFYSILTLNHYR